MVGGVPAKVPVVPTLLSEVINAHTELEDVPNSHLIRVGKFSAFGV